ncbi:MFS transporter, partial [Streptomyces sp. SID161]|nr:MFS transporter [Streptomyces sp. SID161]
MPEKTLAAGSHAGAAPTEKGAASPRRWWILAVVAIAQLMVVLDATIVNIALPSAQTDLG